MGLYGAVLGLEGACYFGCYGPLLVGMVLYVGGKVSHGGDLGALMGLSWGCHGTATGLPRDRHWAANELPRGSHGALVGLSWGSRGALVGLSWGFHGASMGLPWGCHGAFMRLLMGLPWSCYAAFMGPRCGLYGNADMSAVFWGWSPSVQRRRSTSCVTMDLHVLARARGHELAVVPVWKGHR